MPQEVQIVPSYLHPHVMTVINDNTIFEDSANTVDNNVKFIAVFMSGQGIDNKFIKKDQLKDFKRTYGEQNFAKYGQPQAMPYVLLTAGNATVYCMRVMPEDACYANAIISMLYKKDTETGKFIIKYTSEYATDVQDKTILEIKAASVQTEEPDADGFIKVPLGYICMAGRGDYGNKFRIRISNDYDYEKNYGIKMYDFEAISALDGLSKVATYVGGIVTSPQYNSSTLITDVIDEQEVGSSYFDIKIFEENVEAVYKEFVTFYNGLADELKDDVLPSIDEFDPLFGLHLVSTSLHKNIQIDTSDEDAILLDSPDGIPLAGGSDGAFAEGTDPTIREEAITKAYSNAFEGVLDKQILSPRRIPADVLLDANYPYEAKESLCNLANAREDALLYLDAGIINNVAEIDNVIAEYAMFNTRNITKDFQHYQIRDSITKKKVNVTTTYFYAQNIANHFKIYGNHVPFVKKYCTLSGHIKNSMLPAIELIDMDLKEKLYENRFNYFESIAEDTFVKACQNTSQNYNSDLLEENNMHVLFELKRGLERDANERLYNFADPDDRKQFAEYENAKYATWIGRKLMSLSIEFDMNAWEAERSILHCYVAVTFRTLNKRTIIEIDVNKRDFGA